MRLKRNKPEVKRLWESKRLKRSTVRDRERGSEIGAWWRQCGKVWRLGQDEWEHVVWHSELREAKATKRHEYERDRESDLLILWYKLYLILERGGQLGFFLLFIYLFIILNFNIYFKILIYIYIRCGAVQFTTIYVAVWFRYFWMVMVQFEWFLRFGEHP